MVAWSDWGEVGLHLDDCSVCVALGAETGRLPDERWMLRLEDGRRVESFLQALAMCQSSWTASVVARDICFMVRVV